MLPRWKVCSAVKGCVAPSATSTTHEPMSAGARTASPRPRRRLDPIWRAFRRSWERRGFFRGVLPEELRRVNVERRCGDASVAALLYPRQVSRELIQY